MHRSVHARLTSSKTLPEDSIACAAARISRSHASSTLSWPTLLTGCALRVLRAVHTRLGGGPHERT
jgi:hypothetical protein